MYNELVRRVPEGARDTDVKKGMSAPNIPSSLCCQFPAAVRAWCGCSCNHTLDPVRHCYNKQLTTVPTIVKTYETRHKIVPELKTRKKKVTVNRKKTIYVDKTEYTKHYKTATKYSKEKHMTEVQTPFLAAKDCPCYDRNCGCAGQAGCGCCRP